MTAHDAALLPPRTVSPGSRCGSSGPILDLVRGKYADDAVDILKYMPHRGARMIEQVLKSAMANAEDKGIRNVGDLVITDARGDGGPMFKRLMPRARGMAYMIRRRSAHIQIGLTDLATLLTPPTAAPRPIRTNPKGRITDGTEGSPDRLPRRDHGRLAEPLVRLQARVLRPPGRGLQDPQVHQEEVQLRGHPQDRDRADPRRRHGLPLRPRGPGIIIGRKGAEVEKLKEELQGLTGRRIEIKIVEVNRPEIDAQLISEDIAEQLQKRSSFRRTMKRALEQTMDGGAKGVKIQLSGRLGGSEMSRTESANLGSIPPEHAPGQDRLRLLRGQDGARSHRHQSVGQPRRLSEDGGRHRCP